MLMADRRNDILLFEMISPKLNFLKLHERKAALMTCRNSWQMFSVKQGCPLNKLGLPLPLLPRILFKKKIKTKTQEECNA